MDDNKREINLALENLSKSYAPYSKFHVSCVLVTKDDEIYTGVNIENASFSPTICAERVAFSKAVSEGKKEFKRITIVGGLDGKVEDYCSPCGVCRQVMMEFCEPETFEVVLAKTPDDYRTFSLKELLPLGFGPSNLL